MAWRSETANELRSEPSSKGEVGLVELDRALALDPTSVVVRALRGLY